MKKLVSLLFIGVLVLAGCSSTGSSPTDELDPNQEVTLSVMGWSFGAEDNGDNINREAIKAYEELNPNVTIEVIAPADGEDYNEMFNNMVAAGDMPDVFMWANPTEVIVNGWAMDITDLAKEDEDFLALAPILQESADFNGSIYGVPTSINFLGFYQNLSLLDQLNVEPLEYGYTMDNFEQNLLDTTTDTTHGADSDSILDWYAPVMSDEYEWFNFDGEKFDFNSEVFIEGLELRQSLCKANAIKVCAQKEVLPPDTWPIATGKIAYQYDGSWFNPGDEFEEDWNWIGLPNGEFTIAPDYLYISEGSQNAQWAYDFAKFYGTGSYQARYEHAVSTNQVAPIPLTSNEEDVAAFKRFFSGEEVDAEGVAITAQPNIITAYDAMIAGDAGLLEGFKVIPGYYMARYKADTGIINADGTSTYTIEELLNEISSGNLNYNDYVTQLEELANAEYQEALESIE